MQLLHSTLHGDCVSCAPASACPLYSQSAVALQVAGMGHLPVGGLGLPPKMEVMRRMKVDLPHPTGNTGRSGVRQLTQESCAQTPLDRTPGGLT
jgi:hypothetical protein